MIVLGISTTQVHASVPALSQQRMAQVQKLFELTEELTTPNQWVAYDSLHDYLFLLKKLIDESGEALYAQRIRNREVILTPAQQLVVLAHDRFIPRIARVGNLGAPKPGDYAFIRVAYNKMQEPAVLR